MLVNLQRIILTFWIGGLWTVGYLVAPVLFSSLQNPQLAGTIAGQLFSLMSVFGLAVAPMLMIIYSFRDRARWRFIVLLLMLIFIAVNLFYLTPEIAGLREQAAGPIVKGTAIHERFAMLHGIASGLFLLVSLLGLLLVVRQPDRPS